MISYGAQVDLLKSFVGCLERLIPYFGVARPEDAIHCILTRDTLLSTPKVSGRLGIVAEQFFSSTDVN